jgi:peptidoglycan hydrolase-like protein with peptidoglycan-binding domain
MDADIEVEELGGRQASDKAMEELTNAAVTRYQDLSRQGRQVVNPVLSERLAAAGYAGATVAERVKALQRFHGKAQDGNPFEEIISLLKVDRALGSRLRAILGGPTGEERLHPELTGRQTSPPASLPELWSAFQTLHKVPPDGVFSSDLQAVLDQDVKLATKLAEVGFPTGRLGLPGSIEAYRSSRSLPAGVDPESEAFRTALDGDVSIAMAVLEARFRFAVGAGSGDTRIIGASPSGSVLIHDGDRTELWEARLGRVSRISVANPITAFESSFAIDAARFGDRASKFLYVRSWADSESAKVDLTVGEQNVSLTARSLRRFVANGDPIPELDAALSGLKAERGRARLIVLRDPIVAHASLGVDNRPDAPIEFSNVLETGRSVLNPEALARALKARYDDQVEVLLANDPLLASLNAERLPTASRAKDVTIYSRTPITDYDLIARRSSQLEQSGIRVYFGSEKSASANVVLVTGSRNAALQNELEKLLSDGLLESKILVLLSCYSGACELSQSSLLHSRRGPAGILFYPTRIRPEAVDAVLMRLSDVLSRDNAPERISRHLTQAVDEAASATTDPQLRNEILKMRDSLLQVWDLIVPSRTDVHAKATSAGD